VSLYQLRAITSYSCVFSLAGHSLQDGQDAWDIENQTRGSMTNFLKSHIAEYRPDTDALLIMSDIDEIPSAHSIRLLKACDFGSSLHLQLRNYLYRCVCWLIFLALTDDLIVSNGFWAWIAGGPVSTNGTFGERNTDIQSKQT